MKLKISISLLITVFFTNFYAQLSQVKFNEKKIIICYKNNDTKLLTAKILTSINNPLLTTCIGTNSSTCTGIITPTIQKLPVTTMNFPAYGPTPYFISEKGKRCQFLVRAKDINPTNGAYYSIIKSISFYVTSLINVTQVNVPNFKIKMKCTDSTELDGNFTPTSGPVGNPTNGFVTVFNGPITMPATAPAWLKHTFPLTAGFAWDGEKNIIIDICFDGLTPLSLVNPIVSGRRNMPYISSLYSSSAIINNHCGNDTTELDGTNNYLPDMRFEICQPVLPIANYNITWTIINQPPPSTASMLLPNIPATLTNSIVMTKNGTYQIEITVQNKTIPSDVSKDTVRVELKAIVKPVFNFKNDTILCSTDDTLLLSNRISPKNGKFSIVGTGGGLFQTNSPPSAYFNPKLSFKFFPLFNTIKYTIVDSPCVYGDSSRRIGVVFFREAEIINDPGKPICWEDKNLTLIPKFFFAYPEAKFIGPFVDSITGEFKHKLAGVGTHILGYATQNKNDRCGERNAITVKVVAQPQFLIGPTLIDGCAPLTIKFGTNGPSKLVKHDWRFTLDENGKIDTSLDASPTETFTKIGLNKIELMATDTNGCTDTTERYANVFPVPNATFISSKKEVSNIFGEVTFDNNTKDAQKFNWKIEDFISYNVNDTSVFKYNFKDKAGTFVVQLIATNVENCSDTAYDTIVVVSDYKFFIPTAFNLKSPSPNNVFKYSIKDAPTSQDFSFMVFDKWGGKVFESKKNGEFWNGKKDNTGGLCEAGLYLWQFSFKDYAKKIQKKSGSVLLIE
jgi:hypothetical protein